MNFDERNYPSQVTAQCFSDINIKMADKVRKANYGHEDEIALSFFGRKFSYGALFAAIERYARALKAAGIGKGDVVTVCDANTPETVFLVYACNEVGAAAYLVDPRCTSGKLKSCLEESGSRLFMCESSAFFSKVAPFINDFTAERFVVLPALYSLGGLFWNIRRKTRKIRRTQFISDFLEAGASFTANYSSLYDETLPAIIVNTSGTTSDRVKGAVHRDREYNFLVNQINALYGMSPENRVSRGETCYGYIPFFAMYGSSTGMHWSLCSGITLDIIPRLDWNKTVRELIRNKSNYLVSVPALIDKFISYADAKKPDLSFVKSYVIGGDNISSARLAEFTRVLLECGGKRPFLYGYGTTETMVISCSKPDGKLNEESCGFILPCVDILIVDPETGEEQPFMSEGEIWISSPTVFAGYLNRPKETEAVFAERHEKRWFRTGDRGYLSSDGALYVCGRYKRLMKRPDGHQVSPIPIENALAACPGVADSAVAGIKKDAADGGVIPTAFVVKKYAVGDDEDWIRRLADESVRVLSGDRETALAYCIVDRIPLTENGKQDYRTLEKHFFGDSSTWYVIDDLMTSSYLKGVPNVRFIKK